MTNGLIGCESCEHKEEECNLNMLYSLCLTKGECKYIGNKEDNIFHYSEYKPDMANILLFPMTIHRGH
jgi:hypothetical protein